MMVRTGTAASTVATRLAVIEDDDLTRAELVEALGTSADGYGDFHSYVAAGRFAEVVLLDLGLPGLDGFQAIERLAAMSSPPRLILVSGTDRSLLKAAEQIASGLGLHVAGAFAKPADPDLLVAAAKSALQAQPDRPETSQIPDTNIIDSLAESGLEVEFQPKVDLVTGSWKAAEALLRLKHPTFGPVAAPAVVAAFQRANAVGSLEDWLFLRVLADLAVIRRDAPDFGVAINVLPESLDERNLTDRLLRAARAAGVDPHGITVEIVESGLIEYCPRTRSALARLRLHGLGVAMDDFGIGASNIDRLLELPLTELKLDRSLIVEARTSRATTTMLTGVVRMAQERGVAVTAEGIETSADHHFALEIGCQFGQGYLFARSLSRSDLLAALRSQGSTGRHRIQPLASER